MDNLRKVYLEEVEDLFSKMEESLLLLEKSPGDNSLIAEVFRSMHTLKGSSSMYGSTRVADFVHNLETIFDNVRSGETSLSQDIVDVTFKALDHLKEMVHDPELENAAIAERNEKLTAAIVELLEKSPKVDKSSLEKVEKRNTYFVRFQPDKEIFDDGTNPLFLIDELNDLGTTIVYPYFEEKVILDTLDTKKCHTSWDVILVTDEEENPIRDVFIFVEDTSVVEVTMLFEGDLLKNKDFVNSLPQKDHAGKPLEVEQMKQFVDELGIVAEEVMDEPLQSVGNSEETAGEDHEEDHHPDESKTIVHSDEKITSIRVSSDKLDELMNQVSELVTTQAGLSLYSERNFDPVLDAISDNVEKLSRQLRDIAFEMTLIQIGSLFKRFNRVTRDISSQLGKSVKFVTEGEETELDKKIIDSLADPLMHLIRNSLDHGIESREERLKAGKPEIGTIKLSSYYSGAKVIIQIEDDGKGIDPRGIREKAIKNRLITKEDRLSKKEIFDLIFVPGFSMAENVTDLSGRGVGMDVVKKNILDIRGDISIESEIGKGTTIKMGLPLTLSVIDGLLVKVLNTFFVVPLADIQKCYEIKRTELQNDFNELVVLDEERIPFLDLRKEFDMDMEDLPEKTSVVLLINEDKKIALCVDSIVGEYQAVLKPVGKHYRNQDFVSGATILGDGSIALVLDAYKIVDKKVTKQKRSA